MKVAVFDSHNYDEAYFAKQQNSDINLEFYPTRLTGKTRDLAKGYRAICLFVNDKLDRNSIAYLAQEGLELIALRCAGFNNIDLKACKDFKVKVVRVPEYSPHAVAEHTLALLLCLNRKIHKAYNRVRDLNFSLDHLVGFDIYGKKVGVVGTGKIGSCFAKMLSGLGAEVLGYDTSPNPDLESILTYRSFEDIIRSSDIISLHLPLTTSSHHLLSREVFKQFKDSIYIINTSRGGLIDTKALIENLKTGKVAGAALDVYEEEEHCFFEDHSFEVLQDDVLARLLSFPNVLVTSHQAFLTEEALNNICKTTMDNLLAFNSGSSLEFEL